MFKALFACVKSSKEVLVDEALVDEVLVDEKGADEALVDEAGVVVGNNSDNTIEIIPHDSRAHDSCAEDKPTEDGPIIIQKTLVHEILSWDAERIRQSGMHKDLFQGVKEYLERNGKSESCRNDMVILVSRVSRTLLKDLHQDSILQFLKAIYKVFPKFGSNYIAYYYLSQIIKNSKSNSDALKNIDSCIYSSVELFEDLLRPLFSNCLDYLDQYPTKHKIIPFLEHYTNYKMHTSFFDDYGKRFATIDPFREPVPVIQDSYTSYSYERTVVSYWLGMIDQLTEQEILEIGILNRTLENVRQLSIELVRKPPIMQDDESILIRKILKNSPSIELQKIMLYEIELQLEKIWLDKREDIKKRLLPMLNILTYFVENADSSHHARIEDIFVNYIKLYSKNIEEMKDSLRAYLCYLKINAKNIFSSDKPSEDLIELLIEFATINTNTKSNNYYYHERHGKYYLNVNSIELIAKIVSHIDLQQLQEKQFFEKSLMLFRLTSAPLSCFLANIFAEMMRNSGEQLHEYLIDACFDLFEAREPKTKYKYSDRLLEWATDSCFFPLFHSEIIPLFSTEVQEKYANKLAESLAKIFAWVEFASDGLMEALGVIEPEVIRKTDLLDVILKNLTSGELAIKYESRLIDAITYITKKYHYDFWSIDRFEPESVWQLYANKLESRASSELILGAIIQLIKVKMELFPESYKDKKFLEQLPTYIPTEAQHKRTEEYSKWQYKWRDCNEEDYICLPYWLNFGRYYAEVVPLGDEDIAHTDC